MGMKPGQYLFYLYSAILLVILFFILVFPGLRNNGSEVSFESDPAGTSVWMGDTYVGSTPCTAFVPAGNHTFVFRKTGYEEKAHAAEIGGRIFASALIPAKATVSEKLEMKNLDIILKKGFREFSEWGLINSFSPSYQPEPVLENSALAVPESRRKDPAVQAFLADSIRNVFSPELMKDYAKAYEIINGSLEGIPVTASHLGLCGNGIAGINPKPDAPLNESRNPLSGAVSVPGISLREVPGGTYILGNKARSIPTENAPALYTKKINGFYISEQITNREFSAFLKSEKKWRRENIKNLMAENLVTDRYLQSNPDLPRDDNPVTFVSYHAAEAYCEWLTGQLPPEIKAEYRFRLPSEYEWEAWARNNGTTEMQTVWDWCGNWYFPADTFYEGTSAFDGAEISVRGGSWINDKGSVSVWSRGCQPPEWCTPVLGFRVILAGK